MLFKFTNQRYQRATKWGLRFLALFSVVLICLPLVFKLGIEYGLSSFGAKQATVEDVDFNPFIGRMVIKGVQATGKDSPPLQLDEVSFQISWWSLWSKRFVLEDLAIQGLKMEVSQASDGKVHISGMAIPAAEKEGDQTKSVTAAEEQPWDFGVVRLQFGSSDVTYRSDQLNLVMRIDSLSLTSLLSYAEAIPTVVSFDGAINSAPLKISLKATPFSAPRTAKGNIQIQTLKLADFKQLLPPTINALEGKLGINITLDAQQSQNGDLKIDINGGTNLADLGLQMPEQNMAVHQDSFDWQGAINVTQDAQQLSWLVEGDIKSTNSAVTQLINGEQVPLFESGATNINGIHISQAPDVAIDSIQFTSIKVQLAKTKDGTLQLPSSDNKQPKSQTDSATKQAEDKVSQPPKIKLKHLQIGGDSVVAFKDNSVSPPFNLNLQVSELALEGMDSMQPEHPTAFNMSGKFDKFSSISLKGDLFPFSQKPSLDLTGNITSFELPPLSSYTVSTLGHILESGQLKAELNIKIDKGVIDSKNTLKINQLKLKPGDPEKMAKFDQGLSMPLDSALSLLRDKDDNIQLKLPISGNIKSPDFNIADAINQSLSTAMKFAAMSYIKLALQPFGALVSIYQVANSAGKMVSAVRLDPVSFPPGESQLNEEAKAYLKNTSKLMATRPKLNIKICGKATTLELISILKNQKQEPAQKDPDVIKDKKDSGVLTAEHEELLSVLARARSIAIKDYLVTNGGINAERLFICHPAIDREKTASPRAELIV